MVRSSTPSTHYALPRIKATGHRAMVVGVVSKQPVLGQRSLRLTISAHSLPLTEGGSMTDEVKTKARVRVLLEVTLSDVWGGDCQLSQVHKQAKDSARNILSQAITSSMRDIRMIGEPEVTTIIVEE